MALTERDSQEIQKLLKSLIGKPAWGVSLGVGSFITLEFGNPVLNPDKLEAMHGEWHLWVYYCAWRLEDGNEVIAASEDPRQKIKMAIQRLEGLPIHSIETILPALDTIFRFDKRVTLRLFSTFSEEYEPWMLFTPDGRVLVIGPGARWSYCQA